MIKYGHNKITSCGFRLKRNYLPFPARTSFIDKQSLADSRFQQQQKQVLVQCSILFRPTFHQNVPHFNHTTRILFLDFILFSSINFNYMLITA